MGAENKKDDGVATETKQRSSAYLSRGLEQLVSELAAHKHEFWDYDVLIIGSGYGGAVAAAELAGSTNGQGKKVSVCVLERGREYLPGMFPSRMAEMAGHIRCSTAASPSALAPGRIA